MQGKPSYSHIKIQENRVTGRLVTLVSRVIALEAQSEHSIDQAKNEYPPCIIEYHVQDKSPNLHLCQKLEIPQN